MFDRIWNKIRSWTIFAYDVTVLTRRIDQLHPECLISGTMTIHASLNCPNWHWTINIGPWTINIDAYSKQALTSPSRMQTAAWIPLAPNRLPLHLQEGQPEQTWGRETGGVCKRKARACPRFAWCRKVCVFARTEMKAFLLQPAPKHAVR